MNTQHAANYTAVDSPVSVGKKAFRLPLLIGIWLFIACLLIQVFTVGMAVFVNPTWWAHHGQFSYVIGCLGLIILLLALLGRFPKPILGWAGLINGLFLVQGGTVHLAALPALSLGAAFHPVNALLLFWAATAIAQKIGQNVVIPKTVTERLNPLPRSGSVRSPLNDD